MLKIYGYDANRCDHISSYNFCGIRVVYACTVTYMYIYMYIHMYMYMYMYLSLSVLGLLELLSPTLSWILQELTATDTRSGITLL